MQFLVMTSDIGEVDWGGRGPLLEAEAAWVWRLTKAGTIRQIWFTEKTHDAVLLCEQASEERLRADLDQLPLVQGGLIQYQVYGLGAYTGFERLHRGRG